MQLASHPPVPLDATGLSDAPAGHARGLGLAIPPAAERGAPPCRDRYSDLLFSRPATPLAISPALPDYPAAACGSGQLPALHPLRHRGVTASVCARRRRVPSLPDAEAPFLQALRPARGCGCGKEKPAANRYFGFHCIHPVDDRAQGTPHTGPPPTIKLNAPSTTTSVQDKLRQLHDPADPRSPPNTGRRVLVARQHRFFRHDVVHQDVADT